MKPTTAVWFKGLFAVLLMAFGVISYAAPQDHWYLERQWPAAFLYNFPSPRMVCSPSGEILVLPTIADSGGALHVFDTNGLELRAWSVPYACDVDVDTNGLVYVLTTNMVEVFESSSSSNLVRQFPVDGTAIVSSNGIAVSRNGLVAVSLTLSNQIAIYDASGNFLRKWGVGGYLPGELNRPADIAFGASGFLYVVCDGSGVQRFDSYGNYDSTLADAHHNPSHPVVVSPDEAVLSDSGAFSTDGQFLYADSPNTYGINDGTPQWLSAMSDWGNVGVYRRLYRTLPPATNVSAVPLPVLLHVAQRAGTTLVDVDYSVIDPDNPTVQVAAAAFLSGGTSLNDIVPMRTFVEGTTNAVGAAITTGSSHHLTWDAAADLATNFVSLQVEVLAKDNRGLCGLDFLTIPASTNGPALTISRTGLASEDFLNAWVWLVATGDATVALTNGTLVAVGGAYGGQALASGSDTTSAGQSFLFSLLNVRAATPAEITRASAGNYGYSGGGVSVVKLP